MLPYINDFFFKIGISTYEILLSLGIIIAVICFGLLAKRTKLDRGAYCFYLVAGILSIGAGLFSAFLFQAIYNYAQTGEFVLAGMTVMGGIVGATIFFVLFTLIFGNLKWKFRPMFFAAVNIMVPCVVIAQCIGRVGCFSAGCCYGRETESDCGVIFVKGFFPDGQAVYHDHPRLPTQLFEAAFLLVLFVAMIIIIFCTKQKLSALIYLYAYPIFRFVIEFLRDDPRGASLLGLSPSQVQCIALLLVGITLTILICVSKTNKHFGGKALWKK